MSGYKEHWTNKIISLCSTMANAQRNVKFLTKRRGTRTWHYMGTSTELTAGDRTQYSGDAPYQNVLLLCQQRTYQLDLEDSNTITQRTTLK